MKKLTLILFLWISSLASGQDGQWHHNINGMVFMFDISLNLTQTGIISKYANNVITMPERIDTVFIAFDTLLYYAVTIDNPVTITGRHIAVYQKEGRMIVDNSKLVEKVKALLELHSCEEEGLTSGQPTAEQWRKAVNELRKLIY